MRTNSALRCVVIVSQCFFFFFSASVLQQHFIGDPPKHWHGGSGTGWYWSKNFRALIEVLERTAGSFNGEKWCALSAICTARGVYAQAKRTANFCCGKTIHYLPGMRFNAEETLTYTRVNLPPQLRPCYEANGGGRGGAGCMTPKTRSIYGSRLQKTLCAG